MNAVTRWLGGRGEGRGRGGGGEGEGRGSGGASIKLGFFYRSFLWDRRSSTTGLDGYYGGDRATGLWGLGGSLGLELKG